MGPGLPASLALLAATMASAAPSERVATDVGGARLEVPGGFNALPPALYGGSAVLLPLVEAEGAPREVIAAFAEAAVPGGATLVVGRIGAALPPETRRRAAVASAVASHFRQELDLQVMVDRPVLVLRPGAERVELRARTRVGTDERIARFAFFPAEGSTWVVVAAYPAARDEELTGLIGAAFATFAPPPAPASVRLSGSTARATAFGAAGIVLALGFRLWRRRAAG